MIRSGVYRKGRTASVPVLPFLCENVGDLLSDEGGSLVRYVCDFAFEDFLLGHFGVMAAGVFHTLAGGVGVGDALGGLRVEEYADAVVEGDGFGEVTFLAEDSFIGDVAQTDNGAVVTGVGRCGVVFEGLCFVGFHAEPFLIAISYAVESLCITRLGCFLEEFERL